MEFNLLEETKRFISRFRLLETNEHYELSDIMEVIFLEMLKLPEKDLDQMGQLEKWTFFLENVGKEKNATQIIEQRGCCKTCF